ncbi:YfjI family protein [Chromobacterium violaceum]|uniref:YfjI family protein n=1 Tax=Chromobacterium violaceum TaxID=536 RepID=UPI0009BA59F4|nr:YfjI family protein [Chromobacterium violaceum]
MKPFRQQSPFPVHALPRTLQRAVLDVHQQIQSPLSMVATFAISVASEAVHGNAVLQLPDGQRSLLSNWTLVIAESGTGKTPTMEKLRLPIIQFEAEKQHQHEMQHRQYKAEYGSWKAIKDALVSQLQRDVRNEVDKTASQKRLDVHILNEPRPPRLVKLTYSDATPQAFFSGLFENWPCATLTSDEASIFFNGAMSQSLAQLNQRWEAGPLSIDRRSNTKQIYVQDPRVMLNLAIQPSPFDRYWTRSGNEARDLGFFARLLVCCPDNNEENYTIDGYNHNPDGLNNFHYRINELLDQSVSNQGTRNNGSITITFNHEAQHHANEYLALIKLHSQAGGKLAGIKDYAAKMNRHFARLAGVFEYFETGSTQISLSTANCASQVCSWYANEYIRLFQEDTFHRMKSDSDTILNWIQRKRYRYIKKNDIRKYSPIRDKERINKALDKLAYDGAISIFRYIKTWVVDVLPYQEFNSFQLEADISDPYGR